MHGLIFAELKKFVVAQLGGDGWNKLEQKAGLANKIYMPNQVYSDDELQRLVQAAVEITGMPVKDVQAAFGEFAAPELLKLYQSQINPKWTSLDLIEKTEEMVHRVVRLKIPGASPPHLKCTRPTPSRVLIEYSSPRKMCGVAMGLARGVGTRYKEKLKVSEESCMYNGAPSCKIAVENVK